MIVFNLRKQIVVVIVVVYVFLGGSISLTDGCLMGVGDCVAQFARRGKTHTTTQPRDEDKENDTRRRAGGKRTKTKRRTTKQKHKGQ